MVANETLLGHTYWDTIRIPAGHITSPLYDIVAMPKPPKGHLKVTRSPFVLCLLFASRYLPPHVLRKITKRERMCCCLNCVIASQVPPAFKMLWVFYWVNSTTEKRGMQSNSFLNMFHSCATDPPLKRET